jgi:hypothetical protein
LQVKELLSGDRQEALDFHLRGLKGERLLSLTYGFGRRLRHRVPELGVLQ